MTGRVGTQALFSIVIAGFLAVIFALAYRDPSRRFAGAWWLEFLGFFCLVFLGIWGGGVWLRSTNFDLWTLSPLLAAAIVFGIFFIAASRRRRAETRAGPQAVQPDMSLARAVLVWVSLVVLGVMMVAVYYLRFFR
jgi:hypothetical protein